jgi:UDP:flavonoid glycosyltransferase YjiC (YdhE family)
MATILFTWELGGGLGHVLRFRSLAERLIARGHCVVAALRELKQAEIAFGRHPHPVPLPSRERERQEIEYLPAPYLAWRISKPIEPVRGYAELLHNVGFGTVEDLRILTCAWQSLFAMARPDVIVCDHSPTAVLAASLVEIPFVLIGTGFCCPPTGDGELPSLRPWLDEQRGLKPALQDGIHHSPTHHSPAHVLSNINEIRAAHGKPAWQRLAEMYSSAKEVFLTTFAELDHFPQRGEARYWGAWESDRGERFTWPNPAAQGGQSSFARFDELHRRPTTSQKGTVSAGFGSGPRVFMYTHRFAARDWLLGQLRERGFPTVVYTFDLARETAERLAGSTVWPATAPLSIAQAAAECDIAILNAGHNASAQFLLAGKPLLLLPISLEQGILMRRLVEQGLGVSANIDRPDEINAALNNLLANDRYRIAAQAFAAKYSGYNASAAQEGIIGNLEALTGRAVASNAMTRTTGCR